MTKINSLIDNAINKLTYKNCFLYVNFPFCNNRCRYCIYFIEKYNKHHLKLFLTYFHKEILLYSKILKGKKFINLHIGGGTPNLIPPKLLLDPLKNIVDFNNIKRFVVEIFPRDNINRYLKQLGEYNIKKIQIGIQALNHNILKEENRATSGDILYNLNILKKSGLIWSIDLMYGFLGEKKYKRDYLTELKLLLKYKPHGFHLYPVRLEKHNKYYLKVKNNKNGLKYKEEIKQYAEITASLKAVGYICVRDEWCRDKNIDFAKNTICYNKKTGAFPNIIGLGPGAKSHSRFIHYKNTKKLKKYANLLSKDQFPVEKSLNFFNNNLFPIYSMYEEIRMTSEFNIKKHMENNKLNESEKRKIYELIKHLKEKRIRFKIIDLIFTIPKDQYSLCLFVMEEFMQKNNL